MATINKSKKQAEEKAKQEIEMKKALEVLMGIDFALFFEQLASDYEVIYSATGRIVNLDESYLEELKSLLKRNYRKVSDVFDKQTRRQIEDTIDFDIYEINEEADNKLKKRIAMAIGAYLLTRADDIAPKIAYTIQTELIKQTNNVIIENASLGKALSNAEVANTVSNNFAEWGVNHSKTIAMTEVQDVAETSKYTENSSFDELADNEEELGEIQQGAEKVWITAGDEKVRSSHSAIDGVVIPADQYFITGMGSSMRYCGDMSLGADLSDVINCRCETIYRYNAEAIKVIKNKLYRRK